MHVTIEGLLTFTLRKQSRNTNQINSIYYVKRRGKVTDLICFKVMFKSINKTNTYSWEKRLAFAVSYHSESDRAVLVRVPTALVSTLKFQGPHFYTTEPAVNSH